MDLTGNPIILPVGSSPGSLYVTCKLAPIPTPLNPNIASSLPANFVLSFSQTSNAILVQASNATLSLWGTTFTLTRSQNPPLPPNSYDSNYEAVSFPFSFAPSSFSVTVPQGIPRFQTGTNVPAPVNAAFWSLPVTSIKTATGSAPPATQLAALPFEFGAVSLTLGTGLTANFLETVVDCIAPVDLMVDLVSGLRMTGKGIWIGLGPHVSLWNSNSVISLKGSGVGNLNPFSYSNLQGQEKFVVAGNLTASLDQPRNVQNERFYFASIGAFELQNNGESASGTTLTALGVAASGRPNKTSSYGLKNLLLKENDPDLFQVQGLLNSVSGTQITFNGGTVTITSALTYALPFLPDPYTTNIAFTPAAANATTSIGKMTTTVTWSTPANGHIIPTIDITLPNNVFYHLPPIPENPASTPAPALPASDVTALGQLDVVFGAATNTGRSRLLVDQVLNGAQLLDLSTNSSQFGVTFVTWIDADGQTSFVSVADLYLQAPANVIGLTTLPAVSWEPIITDPQDDSEKVTKFPTPLYFPNSGPSTVFGQNNVTLAPITPRSAIDALLAGYNPPSGTPSTVAVRTTLPSGLVAVAELTHPSNPLLFFPPVLEEVQPTFQDTSQSPAVPLQGGDQLSLRPGGTRLIIPTAPQASSTFAGATYQLHDGLDGSGNALDDSAVGPNIDGIFNQEFGPAGSNACVPVTRMDFSGWGESIFSDWSDPTALTGTTGPKVSKVDLGVVTGRTASEVVQIVSDSVPAGARMIFTTTIQRCVLYMTFVLFKKL
jgi:hypothetical protein